MRRSKQLNLKETNQYLIYDHHKVSLFHLPKHTIPFFQKLRGKMKQSLTLLFSYDPVITLLWWIDVIKK